MQLVYIVHEIYKALEEGREMRAVFLDISKAFDRVWHRGLIAKLRSIGVEGNLLNWFISYLQGGGGEETRSGTEKRCSLNLQSGHPAWWSADNYSIFPTVNIFRLFRSKKRTGRGNQKCLKN